LDRLRDVGVSAIAVSGDSNKGTTSLVDLGGLWARGKRCDRAGWLRVVRAGGGSAMMLLGEEAERFASTLHAVYGGVFKIVTRLRMVREERGRQGGTTRGVTK